MVIPVVYCQHCGQQNDDNAEYCAQCGAALQAREPVREVREFRRSGEPKDDECFGLPNGDAICGIIFGGIVIIAGLSWVLGWDFSTLWETAIGPYLVITFGALIILGAVYSSTRKKRRYQ
ncbi:MAG: zinc ribbon domain-containing protein [Candidatus Thorarchaeota archaeon]